MNIDIDFLAISSRQQSQSKNGCNLFAGSDSAEGQSFKDSLNAVQSPDLSNSRVDSDKAGKKDLTQPQDRDDSEVSRPERDEKDDSVTDNSQEKSEEKNPDNSQLVSPEVQALLDNPAADKEAADISTDLSDAIKMPQGTPADVQINAQEPLLSPVDTVKSAAADDGLQALKVLQIPQESEHPGIIRDVSGESTPKDIAQNTANTALEGIESNLDNKLAEMVVPAGPGEIPVETVPLENVPVRDVPAGESSDSGPLKIPGQLRRTFNNIQTPQEPVATPLTPEVSTTSEMPTVASPQAQAAEDKTQLSIQQGAKVSENAASEPAVPVIKETAVSNDERNQVKTDFLNTKNSDSGTAKPLDSQGLSFGEIASKTASLQPQTVDKAADNREILPADSDFELKVETSGQENIDDSMRGISSGRNSTAATRAAGNLDFASDVRNQIQESIQTTVNAGNRQVVVRLNPAELGSVAMRFNENPDGIAGILHVDNDQTRQQIQNALPEIIQNLQNSGLSIKKVEVVLTNQQNQYDSEDKSSAFNGDSNPSTQGEQSSSSSDRSGSYDIWPGGENSSNEPAGGQRFSADGGLNLLI
ncbi:MAG: flagellar hook-length control protein FliK [Anaerohalosphaeraceae bacterium]|nr:flagellar hook-length control protein FliK [Anaerohalosphaeraceae bacterium]